MSNAGSAEQHRRRQYKGTSMQSNTYQNIQSVVGRSNSDIPVSHFNCRECQGRVGNCNCMVTDKEKDDIQTETSSYEELDFSDSAMSKYKSRQFIRNDLVCLYHHVSRHLFTLNK